MNHSPQDIGASGVKGANGGLGGAAAEKKKKTARQRPTLNFFFFFKQTEKMGTC